MPYYLPETALFLFSEAKLRVLAAAIYKILFSGYWSHFSKKGYLKKTQGLIIDQELSLLVIKPGLIKKGLQQPVSTKPVLELRLIKLTYPYIDSTILAQYLSLNAFKYKFNKLQKTLFKRLPALNINISLPIDALPSQVTGVKMQINGRLITQRSIPRKTKKSNYSGTFTVNKNLNSTLSVDSHTSKNKKGAYTIKVWLGAANTTDTN